MKKQIALLLLLASTHLYSAIQELHSFADFPISQQSTTLVCLDLDYTIFMPKEDIFWDQRADLREFIFNLLHALDPQEAYALWQSRTMILVEDIITHVIKHLQAQCIVLGLTSRGPGFSPAFGGNVEDNTHEDLCRLGINFYNEIAYHTLFEDLAHHQPKKLTYPFRKDETLTIPQYKYGICFCGAISKGDMIKRYIKSTNQLIKKVILIDDDYYHLLSVEKACEDLKIAFEGYHYTKAHKEPLKNHPDDLAERFAQEIKKIMAKTLS